MKLVTKVWGAELWIVNNDLYCCKELSIKAGCYCSLHHHKIKDETFVLRSGRVRLMVYGRAFDMVVGTPYRIRPGQKHSFLAREDSLIIEVSTHHEDADSYRENTSGRLTP